jgi:AcrR family transcriptional regulator
MAGAVASSRQEEVLDVVEAAFLRDGIRGMRIGELAAEASCSRSTLYELAPSKEDLLLLVLDRVLRRIMRHGAEAIAAAEDPVERVRALMTVCAVEFAALGPRFLEDVRAHHPSRRLFDRRLAEGRDALELLIEDGVREHRFRSVNARIVAEAIIAVVMRFTDPRFARPRDLAELVDVFIEGLRAR